MEVRDVLLRRKKIVEVKYLQTEQKHTAYVASINANIQSLGYVLSQDLFSALENLSIEELADFNQWFVYELKRSVGADVKYNPMYPNFPKQVMEMSDLELYINALKHYWNRDVHNGLVDGPEYDLDYEPEERLTLVKDLDNLITINLGSREDRLELLRNLLSYSVSYSIQDKRDILAFSKEEKWNKYLPESITNKENLAYLMTLALDSKKYLPDNYDYCMSKKDRELQRKKADNKAIKTAYSLAPFVKSATDVLRIYVGLSDGDISLSEKCSFKSISRKKRRFLLELIEKTKDIDEAMAMRPEEFKKMFRLLHVDSILDYKKNADYPKILYINASYAINKVRDDRIDKTYLSKVEFAIKYGTVHNVVKILQENPGYFARRLDQVLRLANDESEEDFVLNGFKKVAKRIDPKVLLSLMAHIEKRTENKEFRVFFPKGETAKAYTVPDELETISKERAAKVRRVCEEAIKEIYSKKEKMGKVYISDKLKTYKAPMVLRNLSEGSKIITRGSRIPTDKNKNVLRSFIWWADEVDIDLSAMLLDSSYNLIAHISYTDLKNEYGCHSGDITHQRDNGYQGECEFVDIDLKKAEDDNVRFIVYEVHNFSGVYFDKANCKFGYMERTEPFKFEENRNGKSLYPNTGEIFEPLTVKHCMNLSANTTSIMPFIFDIKTREIIWADISISGNFYRNNVEYSFSSAQAVCYACVHSEAPSLYDVLYLNAVSRGELVQSKEEADIVFDIDDGITPYDIDIIVSKYLGG